MPQPPVWDDYQHAPYARLVNTALGAEKENWGKEIKNTGHSGAVKAAQLPSVHLTKDTDGATRVWPALSTAQGSCQAEGNTMLSDFPVWEAGAKKKKTFNINKLPSLEYFVIKENKLRQNLNKWNAYI